MEEKNKTIFWYPHINPICSRHLHLQYIFNVNIVFENKGRLFQIEF